MRAMVLNKSTNLLHDKTPLSLVEMREPVIKDHEVLIRVSTCGVCHTEIDEIEGRTPPPRFPVIPGHEVVGRVVKRGKNARRHKVGDRVGVAWIFSACRKCSLCRGGNENLCEEFRATGRDADGGYAEYMKISEDFAVKLPDLFSDTEAAPFLCAGAIGYRSLMLADISNGMKLGLTGFGASAHLVLKAARHKFPDTEIYVFARSPNEREFAKKLGAVWAGDTEDIPPAKLDRIIDTTPAWKPVVEALGRLRSGGRLVINAIRKEDTDKEYLLNIDYPGHLWLEKEIKSVANVARRDVREFLRLAAEIPIKPEVQQFSLEEANKALLELKNGKIRGAKVLKIEEG